MRITELLHIAAFVAVAMGCAGSGNSDTAGPAPDDCQLDSESEQSPGYPYDLAIFETEVVPFLQQSCGLAGCHAAPNGSGDFSVWFDIARGDCNFVKQFDAVTSRVDLSKAENSSIYAAVSGGLATHPIRYEAGSAELDLLLRFINNAQARAGATTVPGPGASPFDYAVFQQTIQPAFDAAGGTGCSAGGCHGGGAGGFSLTANPAPDSAEMEQNFIAATGYASNFADPGFSAEGTLLYQQALNTHAAGASVTFNQAQALALRDWITAAAEVADGQEIRCVAVDFLDANVFRDEIMPILSGDLDLNDPLNSRTATGCTRGPCHGTSRGPGSLVLSDVVPAEDNLANLSCFINLNAPSASQVLACPLSDPRCRVYPHPGQDVFSGVDDLNYRRILSFIYGANINSSPLDFAFFARRINPIFDDAGSVDPAANAQSCADVNACHGVSVAGGPPPNGSNFGILPTAAEVGSLTYNFVSAASFTNFLDAGESSLLLYPTNEIANIADHPLATGIPHPGGAGFDLGSRQALDILTWAQGLRPDRNGAVLHWLVGGDYPAQLLSDPTAVDEITVRPTIFDPDGSSAFGNAWDGFFSDSALVDLNQPFPRAPGTSRAAYAVVYLMNITGRDLLVELAVSSPNDVRVYAGASVAQATNGNGTSLLVNVPSFDSSGKTVRVLVKVLQQANDNEFNFSMLLRDERGNPITDLTGEIILKLGAELQEGGVQ